MGLPAAHPWLLVAPFAPALAGVALWGAARRGLARDAAGAARIGGALSVAASIATLVVVAPSLRGPARAFLAGGSERIGFVDLRFGLVADRWSAIAAISACVIGSVAAVLSARAGRTRAAALALAAAGSTVLGALADSAWLALFALEIAGAAAIVAALGAPVWSHGARRAVGLLVLALAAGAATAVDEPSAAFTVTRDPSAGDDARVIVSDPSDARVTVERGERRTESRTPFDARLPAGARVGVTAGGSRGPTALVVGRGETVELVPTGASYTYRVLQGQRAAGADRRTGDRSFWVLGLACVAAVLAAARAPAPDRAMGARLGRAAAALVEGPMLLVVVSERLASAGAVSPRAPLLALAANAVVVALALRAAPLPSAALPAAALGHLARGARDLDARVLDPIGRATLVGARLAGVVAAWIDRAVLDAPLARAEGWIVRAIEARSRRA